MKRIIVTSFALAAACAAVGEANRPQCTAKCCKAAAQAAALPPDNGFIGHKAAIKAALAHAKLQESDVRWLKCELDREDGIMVYEVEFKKDGFEYDYDIDAKTGKVLKAKKERD